MTDRVHLSLVDSCIQPQACYQQGWYQGCPLAHNNVMILIQFWYQTRLVTTMVTTLALKSDKRGKLIDSVYSISQVFPSTYNYNS